MPCIKIYAGLFHDDITYPLRLYLKMSLLAVLVVSKFCIMYSPFCQSSIILKFDDI